MNSFEFLEPRSLAEAIALLDTDDSSVRAFSGGTALMLMMKSAVFSPTRLVSLRQVEARYSDIIPGPYGGLAIGALASLSSIENSAEVIRLAPTLPRVMKRLSNVRVRNVARIGGNLAHGDPHMDLPPTLCALRAEIVTQGPSGGRRLALEDFFSGYYETVLGQGELIAEVTVPSQSGWSSSYSKITTRTHDDWPALGVAVSVRTKSDVVADCRIVVSAATEKLTRLIAAESALRGQPPGHATFLRVGEAAAAEAETIDDARGSAAYKTDLLRVHVRRALQAAVDAGVQP
jgi:aerobic carbon-monoxide dehydrogenase medium subunit